VTLDTLQQLIAIIFIDLSLSADNALVIGLAARELAPAHRRTAILVGGALAVGLRVLLTALAAVLLTIPYLQLIGGVALFVIAYRLARPGSHDGGARPAASLRGAIGMIVVADLTTSLEHVLGIGGAAHGDVLLLLIGLGISIPIVLAGSGFVASIVGRLPWTIWLGVIALVWTGVDLFLADPFISTRLDHPWFVDVAFAVAIVAVIYGSTRRKRADVAPDVLGPSPSARRRHDMDDPRIEKRKEVEETTVEQRRSRPGTTNVNIGPNGETQIQENDVVDDPVGTTTVRKETTVEERKEP